MSKNPFLIGIISFSLVLGLGNGTYWVGNAFSTENAKLQQKVESQSSFQKQGEVPLESAVGYDYTRLRELLANRQWQEADEETAKAILKVAGREEEGWLASENIKWFPCEDLRTIDRLWVKYSNGKLGLSVQKEIYQSLGGTLHQSTPFNMDIWEKFGDTVGWREQGEWNDTDELNWESPTAPNTPRGVIPAFAYWPRGREVLGGLWYGRGDGLDRYGRGFARLFSRAETCNL